jgi:hypothetical protein
MWAVQVHLCPASGMSDETLTELKFAALAVVKGVPFHGADQQPEPLDKMPKPLQLLRSNDNPWMGPRLALTRRKTDASRRTKGAGK